MPKFSICIPNYNYAGFVGRTIQSVLDQTYQDYEIIVVDNASTDNSVEVIQSFESDKIKLIVNRFNVGFAPNIQRATEPATGDYIILLSSDDLMLPTALETYAGLIDRFAPNGEEIILHSAGQIVNQDDKVVGMQHKPRGLTITRNNQLSDYIPDPNPSEPELQDSREILSVSLRKTVNPMTFLSTCYSRSLWEKVEGYDTRYHMGPDYYFSLKILAELPVLVYSHQPLFGYRVHDSNQTAQIKKLGMLREHLDYYIHSASYPQEMLDRVGLSREELIDAILDHGFLHKIHRNLADGNWRDAARIFVLAWAVYPQYMWRKPQTYLTGLILLGGPLSVRAAGLVRRYRTLTGATKRARVD